jgi:hypothetical protein
MIPSLHTGGVGFSKSERYLGEIAHVVLKSEGGRNVARGQTLAFLTPE